MSRLDDVEGCTVAYDEGAGCVVMSWIGYSAGRDFRAANERVLGAVRSHGAAKLLGEIEELGRLDETDQAWLERDWIPRAVAAGVRCVALVTPAFGLEHAPVRLVGERLTTPRLEYFDDADAARAWLATC